MIISLLDGGDVQVATLELRNGELADEVTWLRQQLSDRPEVYIFLFSLISINVWYPFSV